MIKLIATDMDGTLLDEKGNLPYNFYSIINNLLKKNILFVVASGRQYYTLLDNFNIINDKIIFIAENGSLVMYKNEELFYSGLSNEISCEIIREARIHPRFEIVLCCKDSAYIEGHNEDFEKEVKKYYKNCIKVNDLLPKVKDVLKIALYDYESTEKYCYPVFKNKWSSLTNIVVSGKNWMDFGPLGVDKGLALKKIQSIFNVSKNESMSFGDYLNDISLLNESYYSFAMENAHDEVKRIANFIAPSNKENGVMNKILEFQKSGLL